MAEPETKIRAQTASAIPFDSQAVQALTRLVHQLGSSLELDQVLRDVAEGVKRYIDYDSFAILLLDDLGHELFFKFAVGYTEEVRVNWRFGMGQGIVGGVAEDQRPQRIGDVRNDPRYIGAARELRSELAIPLIVKNRTIGVLDLGSKRPDFFSEFDQQLVEFLAAQLANSIDNARLYENVREQARTLSLLHESSRELTAILDRETLLHKAGEMIKRLIDYKLFSVMLWNEDTQVLDHSFALGFDGGFCKKGGFPLGTGVTGTAAALRQPVRVPNVHLNPHYTDCGHGIEVRSELAVPMVFKDRLVGVLDLESTEYNAFSAQHEQMLQTLGSYIAVALENARLYETVSAGERRLESDLDTAREIQKGLLPDDAPQTPGAELGFAYKPARQLGGDFYDFLPYRNDRIAFVAGDVAGKGTPAALYASLAVGILRGHVVEHPCEPQEMLREMNQQLGAHRIDNRFVALAFGVFDPADRSVTLANGGFPRPLLVRGGSVSELDVTGMPLGLLADVEYQSLRLELDPGDVVVFCSDGIYESSDNREEFGLRKLQAELAGLAGASAPEIARGLLQSAERYVGDDGREPDDRTVVVLKVL